MTHTSAALPRARADAAPPARSAPTSLHLGRVLWLALAATLLLALAPRLAVLTLSTLDVDESLYALVARDLLRGLVPYQGVFDHQPIALYELFAPFRRCWGRASSPSACSGAPAKLDSLFSRALFFGQASTTRGVWAGQDKPGGSHALSERNRRLVGWRTRQV